VVLVVIGGIFVLIIAVIALAVVVLQEYQEVQSLRATLDAVREDQEATNARLVTVQSTAVAMESQVAALEARDPAQQLASLQAALDNVSDDQELATLRASLRELQARVSTLQLALDELAAKTEALEPGVSDGAAGNTLSKSRLMVARQRQSHNLSCESSAASMVAQYHGVSLSEDDALAALPLNDNPHLGFRGNVDGPTGGLEDYGVYAAPIQAILSAHGLPTWPVDGGLEGIKAAIGRGNPVVAWVTYNCAHSTPVKTTIGGQEVTLVPNQHVVVVTGYNAQGVWANDPWDGQEDFYSYSDFARAMGYFGDMALEVAAP
jgi:uncharacterized protein YvpB